MGERKVKAEGFRSTGTCYVSGNHGMKALVVA